MILTLNNVLIKKNNRNGYGRGTGKPYVRKLILNDRETTPCNKKLVCLTPDLSENYKTKR